MKAFYEKLDENGTLTTSDVAFRPCTENDINFLSSD
jgi:hypothetical protein